MLHKQTHVSILPFQTVQPFRLWRDSPDNDAQVPSPASPKVGTIDVPTSALNHNIQLTKFTFMYSTSNTRNTRLNF